MADRELDEYESVSFYTKHSKPKKAGFSKFQVGDKYYFCRYVDGKIAMISQAYTGQPGRDNGIESVKKNEKLANRYRFESRGRTGQGFGLRAGNGQEIAISPDYTSLGKAQSVASRLSGASFAGQKKAAKKPATKKPATKNPVAKKALAKKTRTRKTPARKAPARKVAAKKTPVRKTSAKTTRFTGKDSRTENYRPLSFYSKNGTTKEGFNSFEKNGAYYFHYVENGKIVLISESYTSRRGRDNGISSVIKNRGLKSAYQYHQHKNGKHYFDLNATNGQEIATSRWYGSNAAARRGAAYLTGEETRPTPAKKTKAKTKTKAKAKASKAKARAAAAPKARSRSDEDNYPPLAFYRRQTKGKKKGFEKFHGDDGEYYFTYFENSKLALISEGYPTALIRDKGLASVEKNMKIEKRYIQGTGADGKPGFILRAGNHKEIARSVGYGSAAAAAAGAAYLLGTRRRPAAKPRVTKPKVKKTVVKKAVVAKPKVKKTVVKKAVVAKPKPKPRPKPKPKPKPIVKPLAAGTVAVAGLAASAAAAKTGEVKKAAVPVKAAPIKVAPPPPPPPPPPVVAAPVAAAPVVAAPVVAAPVAAAAAAIPAAAAPVAGAGIWGWLKWLLLGLLALLAVLFLFKACAGGGAKVTPPLTTAQSPAPAALITCWNGDKAKNDAACPAKIRCWDNSHAISQSACPTRPVERSFDCWDGSKAVDLAGCPIKPAPKVTIAPEPKTPARTAIAAPAPKIARPSVTGRICAPSTNPLFNVSGTRPKTVTRLGTNVQFGNSLSLTPNAFFARLQNRYRTSATDKAFLDLLARSLGHGSFQNMDASMFTNDTLPNGTSGILGLGQQHAVQFSTLNVSDPTHLEAFKVQSANGTDIHFMKRCGNYMYVCQP